MNIPNLLSMLRLAMIPVFCGFFFSGMENAHRIAGIVFLAASATDMLDGYLARRLGQITRLGRVLDPLADKLMTAAALVSLFAARMIPLWIGIVFICKELLMAAGGAVLFRRTDDVPSSNVFGKSATAMFFISIVIMMLFDIPSNISTAMLSVATGLTVVAFASYSVRFCKIVSSK